jgi:hypothetical protein
VHHSLHGVFALREGRWKFVPSRGGGGFSTPKTITPGPGEASGQLFDITTDANETQNLWSAHPEVVERMQKKLHTIQQGDRTRP